jgi:hypothetical protein
VRHAEIIFGLAGQSIYIDPPELARASSPAVTVYMLFQSDDGPAEAATTGNPSVDAVDTTLAADASPGDTVITLASGADVARGQRYLLTSSAGLSEHVDVLGVAGTSITLQRPLINDYAEGAAFQGTRISVALDASWVSNRNKLTDAGLAPDVTLLERHHALDVTTPLGYRVRWTYTIDGAPQLAATYFDLVRYPARSLVSAQDVDNRYPGWIDRLPPDHRANQGANLISSALESIKLDALGDAQILRRLRDTQILRELLICKANVIEVEASQMAGAANTAAVEAAHKAYQLRYDQLVREPKAPSDIFGGGAATGPAERLSVWRR